MDDSDLDTAISRLVASIKLKWKMSMPENSSKEIDALLWFSPTLTSSATSISSYKRQQLSVASIADQVTTSTSSMFTAIQTMQKQKTKEQCKDREEWQAQCEYKHLVLEKQMAYTHLKMDYDTYSQDGT